MLVLSVKRGQTITIGDAVIRVVENKGKIYRVGIEAPKHVPITREDLSDEAKAEIVARAQS